jgi:hypothetical protein
MQLGDAYGQERRRVVFELLVPAMASLGVTKVADVVLRYVSVGATVAAHEVLELAYGTAQRLLRAERPHDEILFEVKKAGAFGGQSMKPHLLRLLRHFRFGELLRLGDADVESLWGENARLLHSTSVVPHAAFRNGRMFAGSFDEVFGSPLLKECFEDCFVPTIREIYEGALYVALGPCPLHALDWCVEHGHLRREQLLGAFCHPSSTGGSKTRYYLREVSLDGLNLRDPTRSQSDWLDRAYERMLESTMRLGAGPDPRPETRHASQSAPADRARRPTRPRRRAGGSGVEPQILDVFHKAGYVALGETKKLARFRPSVGSQILYLDRAASRPNRIRLYAHPDLRRSVLTGLAGVGSVSDGHRFHSNMTEFPKRLHLGRTETAYAWQVTLRSPSDLLRFLNAFEGGRR